MMTATSTMMKLKNTTTTSFSIHTSLSSSSSFARLVMMVKVGSSSSSLSPYVEASQSLLSTRETMRSTTRTRCHSTTTTQSRYPPTFHQHNSSSNHQRRRRRRTHQDHNNHHHRHYLLRQHQQPIINRTYFSTKLRDTAEEVIDALDKMNLFKSSGATIAVGGFGPSGVPETLLDALSQHQKNVQNLTVISVDVGTDTRGVGKLITAGKLLYIRIQYVSKNLPCKIRRL